MLKELKTNHFHTSLSIQIDPVNQECTITTENLNCRFISLVIETLKYKGVKMCETVMERRTLISSKIERIQKLVFNLLFNF